MSTTTTVRSTTGTAPVTFTARRLGEVEILHEDGSARSTTSMRSAAPADEWGRCRELPRTAKRWHYGQGMADDNRVPTTPKQSAWLLAWGTFLVLGGVPVILSAGSIVGAHADPQTLQGLVWAALVAAILGAILLSAGVLRIAQHADRAAGVKADYAAQTPPTSD